MKTKTTVEQYPIGNNIITVRVDWTLSLETGEAFGMDQDGNDWYGWLDHTGRLLNRRKL